MLKSLLKISPKEASFAVRGFAVPDPVLRRKLEMILECFIAGYNKASQTKDPKKLVKYLHQNFDDHHVGFAFEGVGLWFALLDLLPIPSKSTHLTEFLKGAGRDHDYIVAVGAGFAVARLPWGMRGMNDYAETLDPMLAWCIPDGYGFHQGFFHHVRYVDGAEPPPKAVGRLGAPLFDSGVGRAMWWVKCGQPDGISAAIDKFPEPRRAELWGGVGVAAAYAGGVDAAALLRLRDLSGSYQADFLAGLPFAARLRQKGGNYSEVTDLACNVLLDRTTDDVADMAETALAAVRSQMRGRGITNVYELVRQRLVTEIRTRVEVV